MIFPLDSGPDFEESRFCDELNFPGFDRHHGPPLAGFAVSGVLFSRWLKTARRISVPTWEFALKSIHSRESPHNTQHVVPGKVTPERPNVLSEQFG